MKQTIFHFLRILAAAVFGAVVTALLSTAITFLAANPTAFGSVTIVLASIFHLIDDEWLTDAPAIESAVQGQ
jgi:hypothetical protein